MPKRANKPAPRPTSAQKELRTRTRQQSAVAELGNLALSGVAEDGVFDAAASLVADTLGVDASGILELLPGRAASPCIDDLRPRNGFVRRRSSATAG
jgi:hypothetical protein